MALFHFRIKSDKKPDGSKNSAVKHLAYIRREGIFSDFDRQPVNANFVHNLISSTKIKDTCGGCFFQDHHLPKWANDDPKKFFRAANKYEGCGNRRFVEIEFALLNPHVHIMFSERLVDDVEKVSDWLTNIFAEQQNR